MFSPCQRGFPPGALTCSPRVSVGFLQVLRHVLPVSAWVSSRCSDMFSPCQRGFPPGALTCSFSPGPSCESPLKLILSETSWISLMVLGGLLAVLHDGACSQIFQCVAFGPLKAFNMSL
ncbi:hypothetical protein ABVT39_010728 [Epinephelus coioides]